MCTDVPYTESKLRCAILISRLHCALVGVGRDLPLPSAEDLPQSEHRERVEFAVSEKLAFDLARKSGNSRARGDCVLSARLARASYGPPRMSRPPSSISKRSAVEA